MQANYNIELERNTDAVGDKGPSIIVILKGQGNVVKEMIMQKSTVQPYHTTLKVLLSIVHTFLLSLPFITSEYLRKKLHVSENQENLGPLLGHSKFKRDNTYLF